MVLHQPLVVKLEFGNVRFEERGKPKNPGKSLSEQKERINNKLNPHLPSMPGLEPGHIGGRRVLSPLQKNYNNVIVPSESNVIQINNKYYYD